MTKTLEKQLKTNDIDYRYRESYGYGGNYYDFKFYEATNIEFKVVFWSATAEEGIFAAIKSDSKLGKYFFRLESNSVQNIPEECLPNEIE
jgi:hypothetical protein